MCKYQNDAAACYDRITPPHATLCSRKFEVHDTVCKLAANTLRQSQYHIQTARRISSSFYSITKHKTVHGAGQGSGDAGTTFLVVDEPIIETMEKECKCCYMSSPDKTIEWKKIYYRNF